MSKQIKTGKIVKANADGLGDIVVGTVALHDRSTVTIELPGGAEVSVHESAVEPATKRELEKFAAENEANRPEETQMNAAVSIDVKTAKTSELVAFYNEHAEKPVKKFATRAKAEERVAALLANLAPAAPSAPAPTEAPAAPKAPADPEATHAKRAAGTARSWQDPVVAAMRSKRYGVTVDGQEFRSVAQAFGALNLPMSRHIKFRGELRDAGKLTDDDGRVWTIFEHES